MEKQDPWGLPWLQEEPIYRLQWLDWVSSYKGWDKEGPAVYLFPVRRTPVYRLYISSRYGIPLRTGCTSLPGTAYHCVPAVYLFVVRRTTACRLTFTPEQIRVLSAEVIRT